MPDSKSSNAPSPAATTPKATEREKTGFTHDLVEVASLRAAQPAGAKSPEIEKLYNDLRNDELAAMKANPARCSRQRLDELLDAGVFTYEQLLAEGLVTEASWNALNIQRDYLPDMTDFQKGGYEIQTQKEGTDVYFFGMPTSGKTSLIMGIAAANGQGFTLDMRTNGGPYAAALRQYAQAGIIPGRTKGNFVTSISGEINEENSRGRVKMRPINLIEMSGEEFALRIAETKEPSLANMGTGVTNLLRNDNRKAFFIIVDASKPRVKVSYLDHEIEEVDDLNTRVRTRYLSQLDILDKFIVLMGLPENQEIMSKVDAIHFIVTKADAMGKKDERDAKAQQLIYSQYLSVVEQLKNYCRSTGRINRSQDYEPDILTFSLGDFYLGDVFSYNSADTLKIIDAIRESSHRTRPSLNHKFLEFFGLL